MRPSIILRSQKHQKCSFSTLKKQLKEEYLEQSSSVQEALRVLTEVPHPALSSFVLKDDLLIGAEVFSEKTLSPIITLNLGSLLCIDDLLLSSCCNGNFFITEQIEKPLASKPIHAENPFNKERFWDYANILQNNSITALTRCLPNTNSQLEKASSLSSLAIRWIIFHEIAHWLMGHCAISTTNHLNESTHHLFKIAKPVDRIYLSNDEKKCIELQADGLAFELALHHAVYCSVFNQNSDPVWQFLEPGLSDIEQIIHKLRTLIVASTSVILLMERARAQLHSLNKTTYPSPMTRLTNLLASAIRLLSDYCGTTRESEDGRLIIEGEAYLQNQQVFHELAGALSLALVDISTLANILDIEQSLFTLESQKNPSMQDNHTLNLDNNLAFMINLQYYMLRQEAPIEMNAEQQQSIDEYIALHQAQLELNKLLEDYSLIEI